MKLLHANLTCRFNKISNKVFQQETTLQHDAGYLIRKSKDYVYGIWVYKALDIWKGY